MGALQYVDVPEYSGLILRKTYSDLELPGAIMDRAKTWLRPHTTSGEVKWKDKEKRFIFPSGATITFGYLQNKNDKYRYAGAEFNFVAFDELTHFDEDEYLFLFSRLRRDSKSTIPSRMRSATNPGSRGHQWVKKRFVDTPNTPDKVFLPANVFDNPSVDHKDYVKKLDMLDPVTRAQLLNGDWEAKPEGLIYPELEECVVRDWPSHIAGNRFGGIDWGFNDPQVFLAATVDANGVIWIDYERYVRGKPLSQHLEELPPSAKEVTWYADPAQPSLIEEMRRNDYVVRKANNSIIEGINKVKSMIRKKKLKIHPSCKALIAESNLYRWKNQTELDESRYGDNDGGRYDIPIDKHNHCLIAGTLVLTKSGLKNIEDISAGDFVVSPNGLSEVLWSGKTQELATIFTLELEDGRFIQGTECHPVQKENGEWIPLGDLAPGDRIRSLDFDEYQSWLEKDRTLAAEHFSVTNTPRISFVIATVLRVTSEGIKLPVYNLELDESEYDNKAFFANGILVHNCLDALRYLSSAVARLYDDYSADLAIVPDNDTRKLKQTWKLSEGPYERTPQEIEEAKKPVEKTPWWEDTSFTSWF